MASNLRHAESIMYTGLLYRITYYNIGRNDVIPWPKSTEVINENG